MFGLAHADFFERAQSKLFFLCKEFNFSIKTGDFPGALFIVYGTENLKIWIHYGCVEYRPDVTFEIFGKDCMYSDFWRLNEFSKSFFDEYKEGQKFKDTMDYDLTYLEVFLRKYLPFILSDLTNLCNRMAANGHLGYDDVIYPFKKGKIT